jgi:hypothetical protein
MLRIFLPVFMTLERLQAQHKEHPAVAQMLPRLGVSNAMKEDVVFFRTSCQLEDDQELAVSACVRMLTRHRQLPQRPLLHYTCSSCQAGVTRRRSARMHHRGQRAHPLATRAHTHTHAARHRRRRRSSPTT